MTKKKHLKILDELLQRKLSSFERILLFLIFFLSPTQLSKHFWFSWSFIFGIRVDYLSFSLSLVDILIYLLFFVFVARVFFAKKSKTHWSIKHLSPFLFLVFVNTISSLFPLNTLFYVLKTVPLFLLFFCLTSLARKEFLKIFFWASCLSLVFFGTIGVLQVLIGRTLGGIFWFFGERSFNINTAGVALFSFFGRELLRAYSTFPHPNVLAGFFVVVCLLLLSISYEYNYKKKIVLFVVVFSFLPFFLSFSLNSFIALPVSFFVSFLIYQFGKKLFFVFFALILFFNSFFIFVLPDNRDLNLDTTVSERVDLLFSARSVFLKNPILGVGLNNFIPVTFYFGDKGSVNYLLQPVHNIFILFLTETGMLGFFMFCFFFIRYFSLIFLKKDVWLLTSLIFIMLTGLFDHYWLTLEQGRLALVFLVSFLAKDGRSR